MCVNCVADSTTMLFARWIVFHHLPPITLFYLGISAKYCRRTFLRVRHICQLMRGLCCNVFSKRRGRTSSDPAPFFPTDMHRLFLAIAINGTAQCKLPSARICLSNTLSLGLDRLWGQLLTPILFPCFSSRRMAWPSPPLNSSTRGVPGCAGSAVV